MKMWLYPARCELLIDAVLGETEKRSGYDDVVKQKGVLEGT